MPGRPRTPTALAKLTGAYQNHPERFKDRVDPTEGTPIGQPPELMTQAERDCWFRFVLCWPWLTSADRTALTTLCRVTAAVEDPEKLPSIGVMNIQRMLLSEFGGTPSSRSKVQVPQPDDDDDDEFGQFGKPGNA